MMSYDDFREQLVLGLKKIDRKKTVEFAWSCAVQALPFLTKDGNMEFWSDSERQLHLYSILYALDLSISDLDDTLHIDETASKATIAADTAASSGGDKYPAHATSVAYACAYASTTSGVEYTYNELALHAVEYAVDADIEKEVHLEGKMLKNLEYLAQGKELEISHIDYGPIWPRFVEALRNEGCGFWANLYSKAFKNGLATVKEGLERRLSVPREIRERGAAAVGNYLEQAEAAGSLRLNEARIIILGEKGAGKTSIARRLVDPHAPMTRPEESTAGVETSLWKLLQEDLNVRIWDFAGHTVTHAVHQFFLSERCLYIVVYNGRTEANEKLEYWLDHMKNYGGDSRAIILVNKRDGHKSNIPINTLKEDYSIDGLYDFSVKDDGEALKKFRKDIASLIEHNPSWEKQEIPSNYFLVKEELEGLFQKEDDLLGVEHLSRKEFDAIAHKHNIEDTDELLKNLHFLGVGLWYEEMKEFNTLILNPEWISYGVYKIINWANSKSKHSVVLSDFETIFKSDIARFPLDKHGFLFKLIKHYELAYETEEGQRLIIPHLLKEDRPKWIPDFPLDESLILRYKSETPLPPNTISRFTVRHSHQIVKKYNSSLVWRYGVVLMDDKGSIALVRENDRTLSVSVKGPNKTEYITKLRATLNDIFDSYKSNRPEIQYRIERFGQITDHEEKDPIWLNDKKIINHATHQRPYYDDTTDQEIQLERTITNYNISADKVMLGKGMQMTHDQSTNNTFNFQDTNIGLQGSLNELADYLTKTQPDAAEEINDLATALERAESCESPEEVKRKGLDKRLTRWMDSLADENSALHNTVKGVRNGVGIAQDIAAEYNKIAQWMGMPQVPKPFLKKDS